MFAKNKKNSASANIKEQYVVLQFSCLKRCNFNILQCLRKNGRNRIMKVIFADCNSAEKAKFSGCEICFSMNLTKEKIATETTRIWP